MLSISSKSLFLAILCFINSRPNINSPPKIKNIILNVEKLIAACGSDNVVGPIIIAYIEPIIKPNIQYIVWLLYFSNAILINLIISTIPVIIPSPNINNTGK